VARLVDIDPAPAAIAVEPGDILNFAAGGGRIESGEGVVEALGGFAPAVVGTNGEVLAPVSGPVSFLVRAVRPGRARIAIFPGFGVGGGGGGDGPAIVEVTVAGPSGAPDR
jgi:hypothetical protein